MAPPTFLCYYLTWQDPVLTGKIFGSLIAGLVILKTVDLISLFFRLASIGLLVSAAVEYAGVLTTGTGFVTKYKPTIKSYAKEINECALPVIADLNLKFESEWQRIVFAKDVGTTLKAAGLAYILYKITSIFSIFSLVTFFVVLAFTGPVTYNTNQEQIDAAVGKYFKCAKAKACELRCCACKTISPYIEKITKNSGPIGAFISSKLPTRTAGSTVGDNRAATFGTAADEPAVATTTGASKFPEVPTSDLNAATTKEVVDEIKASIDTEKVPGPSF